DAGSTRVKRVLDEFLHDGGRPLDDLARRDAVNENGIETADRHGSFHQGPYEDFTPKLPRTGQVLLPG
ncbi:MAG TPA: hypothetical protein VIF02_13075, partial [Methylocella sp.]